MCGCLDKQPYFCFAEQGAHFLTLMAEHMTLVTDLGWEEEACTLILIQHHILQPSFLTACFGNQELSIHKISDAFLS